VSRTKGLVVAALAVLVAGPLAGCGAGGSADSLTLYNGQHPQTTAALVAAFERDTGISVVVRNNDEETLANQLVAEGSRSPADVIYTENSPPLEALVDEGLLAKVDPKTLARVPARYSSPVGRWVGVSGRISVVVYNTSLVHPSEVPTSVLDLARPRWRGRLALAPGETDFQPIVTSVEHADGKQATLRWLDGLKANAGGHIVPNNETVTSMVDSGQAAIGIIDQYYWYRARADQASSTSHSAIATLAPGDPGYVLDVSGAGVVRSSRHQAAAQSFLAFLTSPTAQHIIGSTASFEYPLATGAPPARGQPPIDRLHPDPISVAELGDGSGAVALLQEAQLL